MSETINTTQVLVTGTYTKSDAYPNVKYRIEQLHRDDSLQVIEVHGQLSATIDYSSSLRKLASIIGLLFQLSIKSIRSICAIVKYRSVDTLYVPYPAIHILFLVSFLPKRFKPDHIVVDVFISIYETVVVDRRLLKASSLMARLLKRFERRAFHAANVLITDTPENSAYFADLLDVSKSRFNALPLSINETDFKPASYKAEHERPLSVLFIGTLVPLHNIGLLCEAISQLDQNSSATFTIIGDGQDAPLLEQFLASHPKNSSIKCEWHRAWHDSAQLAKAVVSADLCIGILGNAGKSQRVWPFKNYLYLASGKALVTADTSVSARLQTLSGNPAFFEVNTSSSTALTLLLNRVIQNPRLLEPVASAAAPFYQENLSNRLIADSLRAIITKA